MKRYQVNNITISPLKNIVKEEVLGYKNIVNTIIDETPKAIEYALNKKKDVATLIEINGSGNFIELKDKWWENAINSCIKKFEDEQDYERCIKLSKLLSRVMKEKIPTATKAKSRKKK